MMILAGGPFGTPSFPFDPLRLNLISRRARPVRWLISADDWYHHINMQSSTANQPSVSVNVEPYTSPLFENYDLQDWNHHVSTLSLLTKVMLNLQS